MIFIVAGMAKTDLVIFAVEGSYIITSVRVLTLWILDEWRLLFGLFLSYHQI